MGREAKFLLAILGLLAGVFVGVLSMKLLVPRPPVGAGPDIHHELASAPSADIVDPPAFARQPTSEATPVEADEPSRYADRSAFAGSRYAPPVHAEEAVAATAAVPEMERTVEPDPAGRDPVGRDPFARTSFEPPQRLAEAAVRDAEPLDPPADASSVDVAVIDPPPGVATAPAAVATYAPPAAPRMPAGSALPYVASAGDSWWSLAERAYGDGRFYRALYAWNRAIDPRVSLVPGTPLEVPPRDKLAAAWPALMPRP